MLVFVLLLGCLGGCGPTVEQRIRRIELEVSRLGQFDPVLYVLHPTPGIALLGQDHPAFARIARARRQVDDKADGWFGLEMPAAMALWALQQHARLDAAERVACRALGMPIPPRLLSGTERLGTRIGGLAALEENAALEAANPLAPGWALRPLRLDPLSLSVQDDLAAERLIEATARLWLAQADEPR